MISKLLVQVRQRDKETREVKIEERRYDKAGQDAVLSSWEDKSTGSGAESMSGLEDVLSASVQAGFGSSYITDDADSDNPYAWAQRLREIPDKVSTLLSFLCSLLNGTLSGPYQDHCISLALSE